MLVLINTGLLWFAITTVILGFLSDTYALKKCALYAFTFHGLFHSLLYLL